MTMNPIQNDFTFIGVSNADMQTFQSNSSSDFKNSLGRTIDFSHYEVGLLSIDFCDTYRKPEAYEQQVRVPVSQSNEPFFNLERGDDKLILNLRLNDYFTYIKIWDNIRALASSLNSEFTNNGINATYSVKYDQGGFAGIAELDYKNEHQYYLHIPLELANVLGFNKTVFEPNRVHKTDRVMTEHSPTAIKNRTAFRIERIKDKVVEVRIGQMERNPPLLEDIAQAMVLAVDSAENTDMSPPTKDFQLSAIVVEDNSAIILTLRPSNATLLLSPYLYRYLGLRDNYQIRGKDTILVDRKIIRPIDEVQEYISKREFLDNVSCSKVIVTCNALDPTYFFKERLYNCIAVLDRIDGVKSQHKVQIKHPVYYKCTSSRLSHLEFSLIDDKNRVLEPEEFPTFVQLHFRKKTIW